MINPTTITRQNSRVLVVSSHFPPRQAAGVYRTLRFARYLPELGWDVHVLTVDPATYEDGAKTDEGLLAKVPESVTVHHTKAVYPIQMLNRFRGLLPFGGQRRTNGSKKTNDGLPADQQTPAAKQNGHQSDGLWQRMKDAVTVPLMTPDMMRGWVRHAVRCGKRVVRDAGIDVLYSSAPPWSNHLVGLQLKRATGRPWIADFRDPWVDADFRPWRTGNSWPARKHQQLERQVIETADVVILNTAASRDKLLARNDDLPSEKFIVIHNGFDPADYGQGNDATIRTKDRDKLVIAHAGTFYGKRNVRTLIEAVGNLCQKQLIPRDAVSLQLIGAAQTGRTDEQEQVAAANVEGVVQLLPRVTHTECLRQMSDADVLLLVQVDAPHSIPGKVFEYIALGKPVLTLAGPGATAELVCQENLGPCVDPENVPEIEAAILELHRRFQSGHLAASVAESTRRRFNGRELTRDLNDVFRFLMGKVKS